MKATQFAHERLEVGRSGEGFKCVTMVGSDHRMDHRGWRRPANALPAKCDLCGMCDLDYIPNPYYLSKGLNSPAEMCEAELGNLLVRERRALFWRPRRQANATF